MLIICLLHRLLCIATISIGLAISLLLLLLLSSDILLILRTNSLPLLIISIHIIWPLRGKIKIRLEKHHSILNIGSRSSIFSWYLSRFIYNIYCTFVPNKIVIYTIYTGFRFGIWTENCFWAHKGGGSKFLMTFPISPHFSQVFIIFSLGCLCILL